MTSDADQDATAQGPLHQAYRGASELLVLIQRPEDPAPLTAVVSCAFDGLEEQYTALLDTGSHYCFMQQALAEQLELSPETGMPSPPVSTRFGTINGGFHRCEVRIPAKVGKDLIVDATWIVSAEWPGPTVLGWIGFLQGTAFGCHPGLTAEDTGTFYFAPV